MRTNIFFTILLLLISASGLISCQDDLLYENYDLGEGRSIVRASATFYQVPINVSRAEVDQTVTGGTPGNAIGAINSLCIVVYSSTGEFVRTYTYDPTAGLDELDNISFSTNTQTSPDAVPDGTHQAESSTMRAEFDLGAKNIEDRLQYGRYHMYAIANMGKISDEICSQGEETLKKQKLSWNKNIADNNQMFGYFTPGESSTSSGFDAPVITVKDPTTTIHSWIKRAVSKVTVAFDGSNLKPGVEVYIKTVEIRDIPLECYLGANNPEKPETEISLKTYNQGQLMTYSDVEGVTDMGLVSLEHPINGYEQQIVNNTTLTNQQKLEMLHGETTNAFFFFENLQGKGKEGTVTDKRQQVTDAHKDLQIVSYPDGGDPTNIAWKDDKQYGTYITVHAYYKSTNPGDVTEGPIIYRFMLGKDVTTDYNAERNYHYKLTLKFNGFANDVDWHIKYDRSPKQLRFPHPFYISYLYGQSTMLPLEFDADSTVKIEKVRYEILSNAWFPLDAQEFAWNGAMDLSTQNSTEKSQPAPKFGNPEYRDIYGKYYLYVGALADAQAYDFDGFLSLNKPSNLLIIPAPGTLTLTSNKDHYQSEKTRVFQGEELGQDREPLYEAQFRDEPHVTWYDGTFYLKLPIWTRAKQMMSTSGFTANNVFQSYFRQAIVKVTITTSEGEYTSGDLNAPDDEKIIVNQVRRIVNPTGVWRSDNNYDPFHVRLMTKDNEDDNDYEVLKSDGLWRAYVGVCDGMDDDGNGGFFHLETKSNKTATRATYKFMWDDKHLTRESIEGAPDSEVDFDIVFDGPNTTGKPRYGLIRVEYHHNSCYHLIYIRQGIKSHDTFNDGTYWITSNMRNGSEPTGDPLDEGSLFKNGNWDGIPTKYNVNDPSKDWTLILPNHFAGNALPNNITTVEGNTKSWSGITYSPCDGKEHFAKPSGMRIAKYTDFEKLWQNPDDGTDNFHIKKDYGILYGDGATETESNYFKATGYKAGGPKTYGMRGCFVYDKFNGHNLFFPIGASGFGHRKDSIHPTGFNNTNEYPTYRGVLRYSCNPRWGYFDTVTDWNKDPSVYKFGVFAAPLFFDIFRSPGALYWYANPTNSYPAWDINYHTLDFSNIEGSSNVGQGADAIFVRCIDEVEGAH